MSADDVIGLAVVLGVWSLLMLGIWLCGEKLERENREWAARDREVDMAAVRRLVASGMSPDEARAEVTRWGGFDR